MWTLPLLSPILCAVIIIVLIYRLEKLLGRRKSKKMDSQQQGSTAILPIEQNQVQPLPTTGFYYLYKLRRRSSTYFEMALHEGKRAPLMLYSMNRFLTWWNNKVLFINDMTYAKEMMHNPAFCDRVDNDFWRWFWGGYDGLINSSGTRFREQKSFVMKKLKEMGFNRKQMASLIGREVDDLLDTWAKQAGQRICVKYSFYLPLLNSVWMILVGKRYADYDNELNQILLRVYKGFVVIFNAPTAALMLVDRPLVGMTSFIKIFAKRPFPNAIAYWETGLQRLSNFFKKTIQEKRKLMTESGKKPTDFVEAYLEQIELTKDENSSFYGKAGEDQLVGHMVDFFIGGGDTCSTLLLWTMLHLVRNPESQAKVREELDRVVGTERKLDLGDRHNCPYLTAFIWECCRMTPIGLTNLPHWTPEATRVGPYIIPKNTVVLLNVVAIHYDESIWGDPHTFRPERFLSEDGKTFIKNEHMLTFSLGKRKCPGTELGLDNLFCFVGGICQRFEVRKDPELPEGVVPPLEAENLTFFYPRQFYVQLIDRKCSDKQKYDLDEE